MLFGLQSTIPIVGASGAIYGVLLAYGVMFPNRTVYLYGIIPIKSIWFVIGIGVIAFFSSFNNFTNISHLTHLFGMIIGYLYLKGQFTLDHYGFQFLKRFWNIESKTKRKRYLDRLK